MHTKNQPLKLTTAVKRIMREMAEFTKIEGDEFNAGPLSMSNMFLWHFTIRGPSDSDFESGIYHGSISLPDTYPFSPPDIMFLTPNGRFEVNKKICLSISGYHPDTWQPSWSIRTVLTALRSFLVTKEEGAIGSLKYPSCERRRLATLSKDWKCSCCDVTMSQILKFKSLTKPENGCKTKIEKNGVKDKQFKFFDRNVAILSLIVFAIFVRRLIFN
ncbi:hypothetical protein MHBO_000407 [Bonamia ostreae]|uniref:UBC core domain-containing protein n=1 Tax=Bonamia ostreae TaxID=126728 RepID=A0ABV2AFI5_9EUKA